MDKETKDNLLMLVRDNYNLIADQYNETRKKPLLPRWQRLFDYVKEIKQGTKILDAGCGNGRLLEAFKDKRIKYLGFDMNGKLVNYARERYSGYDFYVADILDLKNIDNETYDHIFSVAVMNHIPGFDLRVKTIKELATKLKKGGEIFISAWNLWDSNKHRTILYKNALDKLLGKNKMEKGDAIFDWKNADGDVVSKRYYHAFTLRELKKLGTVSGLGVKEVSKDKFNTFAIYKKEV